MKIKSIKKQTNDNVEELQSKTIEWLRFPLIVGVLFIHNGALVVMQCRV